MEDGATATISGWDIPSVEWDVVSVRIYRAASGIIGDIAVDAKKMQVNDPDTVWMYVGETDIGDPNFVDNKLGEELSEAVVPTFLPPPPDNLQGISYLGVSNVWFGFSGNTVYISRNNNPDAWPYWFTLDDEIRAVTSSGGTIFVATCGHPYVIEGVADHKKAPGRAVVRSFEPAPAANPMPRAITPVMNGAVYPSHDGLMFLAQTGQLFNLTDGFYSTEEWRSMLPDTMLPIWFDGRLMVFGRHKSLQFMSQATTKTAWKFEGLTELSDHDVIDWKILPDERLVLLTDGGVYQWGTSTNKRRYFWRSHKFFSPTDIIFGIVQVSMLEEGETTLRIFADDRLVLEQTFGRSKEFRFPSWAHGTSWYYEVEGQGVIGKIAIAPRKEFLR
jgi:hypothetical protein